MIQIHYPPTTPSIQGQSCKLFLAGTIDNGESYNWQQELISFLSENFNKCCLDIFNPRRPDWNPEWNSQNNHPQLEGQIKWELDALEKADVIAMVLWEGSKSPISLLELGAFKDKKILVYCPYGFYRKTNINVFCSRNDINVWEDWDIYKIALKRLVEGTILKL
jgi:hypothetical protein